MPRRHGKKARGKHKFKLNQGVVMHQSGGNSKGWHDPEFPERKLENVHDPKGRV